MSRPHANESVFRAVADPTRRRIIDLLRKSDQSGVDIASAVGASPPTLSHHLGILRTSGVVTQRRQGRSRVYHLQPESLRPSAAWFRAQG